MVRERPGIVADLLRSTGFAVPDFDRAELMSPDLSTLVPTEFRADAVVRFIQDGAEPLASVYEVQLRPDARKRRSWPAYVANTYEQVGCPVVLLVVTPSRRVAQWCATPIAVGEPGFVLTPVVYGPDSVPVITDPEQARRHPQLAVLSALAHGDGSDSKPVLDALMAAMDIADLEHADLYAGAVLGALSETAKSYLEASMATRERRFHLDFLQDSYEKGEVVGRSKDVLVVLDARNVEVPDDVRELITTCTDVEQLEVWVRRAAVASTVDDLFDVPDAA